MNKRIITSLVTILLLSSAAVDTIAFDVDNQVLILAESSPSNVSEDQAAAIASKATGGQVLSSETREKNGITIYRVKVLMRDGHVKIVQVNAASGEII